MRITNSMLSRNMMSNLNDNLQRMAKYQTQSASGRKFDRPSQDPIGMSKSLKLYTDISKVGQYERNLNDAVSWMTTTENAIIEIGEIIKRGRELVGDAANGTKTDTDTQNIADEMKQLKEQLIKIGNTRHAGRSIFTGFKTDKDMFTDSGVYNINMSDKDVSTYNVGISENIDINIVGMRIFGVISDKDILNDNLKHNVNDSADMTNKKNDNLYVIKNKLKESGIPLSINIDDIKEYSDLPTDPNEIDSIKVALGITGGSSEPDELWLNLMHNYGKVNVDMSKGFGNSESNQNDKSSLLQMFDNIISAMDKGDHEQIDKYLADIDKAHGNLLSVRSEIGAKTNRLEMTEKRLSSEKLNFKTVLSLNEDVDYGELSMQIMMAEVVYNASLAVGSKVIQPTLVDFLR